MISPQLRLALAACRQHFTYAAGFSAVLNLLFLAPTLYMLQVYDRVLPSRSGSTLALLSAMLVMALGAQAALDSVRSRLLVRASMRLDSQLASRVFSAALLAAAGRDSSGGGQAMRNFDQVRQTLTGPALIALCDLPWSSLYLMMCFLLHPWLGLLALIGMLAITAVALVTERKTNRPLVAAQLAAQSAYLFQDHVLARADVVRALGMTMAVTQRHTVERKDMLSAQVHASMAASSLQSLSKFLRLVLQSAALGAGAALAIEGKVSAGAIFAASFLINRAMSPIDLVVSQWQPILKTRQAYSELERLLVNAPSDKIQTRLPAPVGHISIEGLSLRHGDRTIVDAVTLAIEAGEAVAVIGPSGAGKSSLLRLLAGAQLPSSGTVRFDGASLSEWDREVLALHVGFLPQDVALLPDTIKTNISRFAAPHAAAPSDIDQRTILAARMAGAHDMILRLPGGYDYLLGVNGSGLSAGQAQRIGLARALYGTPAILILDEPNAQLDAEGELVLLRALSALKERKHTMLFSTHRTGLLGLADKVLVMREGRIERFGPRDEVLGPLQAKKDLPPDRKVIKRD